jgi:hypothetical protein
MAISKEESKENLFINEEAPGNSNETIRILSIKKATIKDNNDQPKIL